MAAVAPSGRAQVAEARRLLQEARRTASPAESRLIDRAQVIVDEAAAIEASIARAGGAGAVQSEIRPGLERIFALYSDLLREWAALAEGDPKVQVTVAATLYSLPDVAESLGVPGPIRDEKWRTDAIARADAALARFPGYARAHAARGYICSREAEEELGCIRHYARCAALAPDDPECRRQLADLSRQYTAPRCETSDLEPGLSIRLGTSRPRRGTTVMTVGTDKLHVSATPSFTRADIAVVRSTVMRTSTSEWNDVSKAFTAPTETEEPAVYFELREERRSAFRSWWADAVFDDGRAFLVLMNGGTLVRAVALARKPLRSPMVITGVPIEKLCKKTRRATLPPDVQAAP